MISTRSVLNALQNVHADALQLFVEEQRHHALCYRSMHLMGHYTELLVGTLKPDIANMSDSDKERLAAGIEHIQYVLEGAAEEAKNGYASVIRRTTIVLSDIVENLVESTIGVCLLHIGEDAQGVRQLTKLKSNPQTEKLLKQAVRNWESSIYTDFPARTDRFNQMLRTFFPDFQPPENFVLLNELIRARNALSHDLIELQDGQASNSGNGWTLQKIDDAFRVAQDFLIAIMLAIPNDYSSPVPIFARPDAN